MPEDTIALPLSSAFVPTVALSEKLPLSVIDTTRLARADNVTVGVTPIRSVASCPVVLFHQRGTALQTERVILRHRNKVVSVSSSAGSTAIALRTS